MIRHRKSKTYLCRYCCEQLIEWRLQGLGLSYISENFGIVPSIINREMVKFPDLEKINTEISRKNDKKKWTPIGKV